MGAASLEEEVEAKSDSSIAMAKLGVGGLLYVWGFAGLSWASLRGM